MDVFFPLIIFFGGLLAVITVLFVAADLASDPAPLTRFGIFDYMMVLGTFLLLAFMLPQFIDRMMTAGWPLRDLSFHKAFAPILLMGLFALISIAKFIWNDPVGRLFGRRLDRDL